MEIKGIKYISPCFDNSGYAKAARGNIMSLYRAGVPLTLAPISFENARPDLGEDGAIMEELVNKKIDYNVVLIHSTPEFWSKHREKDKINVGYTIWETTKIHPDWKGYINSNVDKVLVGCEWNRDVFKECGITIPIGVVPHGINTKSILGVNPFRLAGITEDTFVFYTIMQWTERKNPLDLLKSYWYAFQNNEKVVLVLKAYRNNYSDAEKNVIREALHHMKKNTALDNHAKIHLISNMLSEDEILGLHASCDCYVSLDRGEGFGLSPFTAGAFGKPIVVTGFGGVTEYAKPNSSYLVKYHLSPVSGMWWTPWYKADQLWANVDILDAAEKMRYVFNNREEARARGLVLKKYIEENFSWEVIGQKIIKEIKEI